VACRVAHPPPSEPHGKRRSSFCPAPDTPAFRPRRRRRLSLLLHVLSNDRDRRPTARGSKVRRRPKHTLEVAPSDFWAPGTKSSRGHTLGSTSESAASMSQDLAHSHRPQRPIGLPYSASGPGIDRQSQLNPLRKASRLSPQMLGFRRPVASQTAAPHPNGAPLFIAPA
jgi:hypothetical protein